MDFALSSPNQLQEKTLDSQTFRLNELSVNELLWSKYYQFLKGHGYTLRKRYKPGWQASWLNGHRKISDCEDAILLLEGHTIDATRYDGMLVGLKKIDLRSDTEEIEVGKLFSCPELSQDSRNHCVPILDVLYPPDEAGLAFVVMPLLYPTQVAPFETVGEVIEYIRQIFEGLHFMHENNVAHGDCTDSNIMADSLHLFASAPHPGKPSMTLDYSGKVSKPDSRTNKPVKYYLVGFHKSTSYQKQDNQEKEWVDKSSKNRFAADVYCIGDMLRLHYLDGWENMGIAPKQGFEFMRKLISHMMNGDPNQRPDMGEVVARFESLVDGLSDIQLRSPVIPADDTLGVYRSMTHWTKQLIYMARGIPPIPTVDY